MWGNLKESNVGCFVLRSWQVAWPMTLIMFFEFLIGITDVFVAGRVGKDVQAAYGFVMQVYFIFIVVANALTVGTVSIVSRLFSTNDRDKLSTAIYSSLVAAAVTGVVVAVVGIMIAPALIGSPQHTGASEALCGASRSDIFGGSSLPVSPDHLQRHPQVLQHDPPVPQDDGRRLSIQRRAQSLLRLPHASRLQGDRAWPPPPR